MGIIATSAAPCSTASMTAVCEAQATMESVACAWERAATSLYVPAGPRKLMRIGVSRRWNVQRRLSTVLL